MSPTHNPTADLLVRQMQPPVGPPVTLIEFLDRRLIDTARIELLGSRIHEVVNTLSKPMVLISFAKVEYLSSSALNVLIEIDNVIKQRKGRLVLANLEPELLKVFTLMKLNKVMTICANTDEGLKAFAR